MDHQPAHNQQSQASSPSQSTRNQSDTYPIPQHQIIKMQFSTALVAAFAATMAAASPVLEARASPVIDLWQDQQFLGLKFTGSANAGDCGMQ
jgi:hypothetical protein